MNKLMYYNCYTTPMKTISTWRHTSDIKSNLNIDEIREIIHDKQFVVSQTNNDAKLLNKTVTILLKDTLDNNPNNEPIESSEHIVFFGIIKYTNNVNTIEFKDICIKFRKSKDLENPKYGNYTQKHASYVMYNY